MHGGCHITRAMIEVTIPDPNPKPRPSGLAFWQVNML